MATDLDQREHRAVRAQEVINNPLYVEAWNAVEQEIHKRWAQSPISDIEGQNQLRLMLHLLISLKENFDSVIQDGKLAAYEKQTLKQRVSSMFHR